MKKALSAIITFLFTTSICFAQGKTEVLYVNSKQGNCKTTPYGKCFQIKDAKSRIYKDWENYAGEIRGLNYEEGFLYTIAVKKIKYKKTQTNGINFYYQLLNLISKKAVQSPAKNIKGKINKEKYILYEYLDADTLTWVYDSKKTFIQFDLVAKKITGNDGCNGFFGTIKSIDNKKISFGPIAGTMMACNGINNRDYTIKKLLEKVDGYVVNGKDIDLLQGGTVVLRYSQADYVRVEEDRPF